MFITIKTDGTVEIVPMKMTEKGNPDILAFMDYANNFVDGRYKQENCVYLERHGIKNVKMLRNESSDVKGGYSYNPIASILFGVRENGTIIYGDVCLVWLPWNYLTANNVMRPMETEHVYKLLKIIKEIKENDGDEELWRLKNGLQREI